MGSLAIVNKQGDSKIIWSPDNADEVAAAKAMFDTLTKKGHSIFQVQGEGKAGARMQSFDPQAERLISVPPVVGG